MVLRRSYKPGSLFVASCDGIVPGTQFACKLGFAKELRFRIGQAASAFGAMRKQVFCMPLSARDSTLGWEHGLPHLWAT
jgi:hypothetical protein